MKSPPAIGDKKGTNKSNDMPLFAYLRRSTTNKQEISLENQADNLDLIIRKHNFDKNKIKYFEESHSAFENRKREEFEKMLAEIDKLTTPCILLVRDPSRLSRNPNDSLRIANRLFGDNGSKKKIARIIFFEDGEWDIKSDKINVTQVMLNSYHESITTGKRSKNGVHAKLLRGEYVFRCPQGLKKTKIGGIIHLEETFKMDYVRRAFEMKMAGITHKKIVAYLKSNDIVAWERDLTDRYFTNTTYVGTYTDKKTGQVFESIKFLAGKPPISMTLWRGVQDSKGKKRDNYGEKQPLFKLEGIVKTSPDKRVLTGYFQKGTAQYKNTTEGINISERKIVDQYIKFLREGMIKKILGLKVKELFGNKGIRGQKFIEGVEKMLLNTVTGEGWTLLHDSFKGKDIKIFVPVVDDIEPTLQRLFDSTEWLDKKNEDKNFYFGSAGSGDQEKQQFVSDWFSLVLWINKNFKEMIDFFQENITQVFNTNTSDIRAQQEEIIKKLELEKKRIEEEGKNIMISFLKSANIAGMEDVMKEEIEKNNNRVRCIDEEIEALSSKQDFELFRERLPETLRKTFELCGKVLSDKESDILRQDVYDLIRITAFELKINKKKALEIELFGPVRQVLFGEKSVLEAPSGVEPDYGALQAPA